MTSLPQPQTIIREGESPPSREDGDRQRRQLREQQASATRRRIAASLAILAALAICVVLYVAQALLMPMFLAAMAALVLRPAVRLLHRAYIPRSIGAAVVVGAVVAGLVMGAAELIGPAQEWIVEVPGIVKNFLERPEIAGPVKKAKEVVEEGERLTGDGAPVLKVEVQESQVTDVILSTTSTAATAAFVLVLTYFLLVWGDGMIATLADVFMRPGNQHRLVELVHDVERGVSGYLATVTVINVFLGLAIGTAMWLLGMPNPALWGAMATLLNFIPYLGAAAGILIVGLVAQVELAATPGFALLVPGAYLALTTLEGQFITPTILGRRMELNPILVLLSLAFWGWLWGPAGALLAVPLLAVAKIVHDHRRQSGPWRQLLQLE